MEVRAYNVPDYIKIIEGLESDRLRWLTVPEVLPHAKDLEGLQIVTGTMAIYWGVSDALGKILETFMLATNDFNPFPHFINYLGFASDEYQLKKIHPTELIKKGVKLDGTEIENAHNLEDKAEMLDVERAETLEKLSSLYTLLGANAESTRLNWPDGQYNLFLIKHAGVFVRPVMVIPGDKNTIDFGNKPEGTFYIPVEEKKPNGLDEPV